MARATERGGADRRAMDIIIGAFDDHVESAMSDGLFTGDDRALDALRGARAAYRQHSQTFRSQGAGDDVGHAMEKIIGRNGGDGATPTEVANWLYGQAKVGGTGLSVRLAQRVRNVLGANSPEWSAVRQGLWSRLTEATEGATAMGPQKAANRISEFLNGSGRPLAQIMFTGAERNLMARYAGLQRQLIPRPGAVNHSNTGILLSALKGTANSLAVMFGAAIGGPVGAFVGHMATPLGSKLRENLAAGSLSRSLDETRRTRPPMPPGMGRRAALNAAIGARRPLALPAPAQASAPQDQNDAEQRRQAIIRAVLARQSQNPTLAIRN